MWRLKLTVKPPDAGSSNDMNIHVGLCWGIEVEGEGPLPLNDSAMVQVRLQIHPSCNQVQVRAHLVARLPVGDLLLQHLPSCPNRPPICAIKLSQLAKPS
jgi:hypothetical protein